MQSGSGVGGHCGNPAQSTPPLPRRAPSSSSFPPSSSFTQAGRQQLEQQQQQHVYRQSLLEQQLRKSEGEKGLSLYHSSGIVGVSGGSNFLPSSNGLQRKSSDFSQHNDASHIRDENWNKGHVPEQHVQYSAHQAYLQYASQIAQQNSFGNMQAQQQSKLATVGSSGKDQVLHASSMGMQALTPLQVANQVQVSTIKKSSEQFSRADNQVLRRVDADQGSDFKPSQDVDGKLASANSAQALQSKCSSPDIPNNQIAMAQLKAMQSWALEHNINLSLPDNSNLITQLLPACRSSVSEMQKSKVNSMVLHQDHHQNELSDHGNPLNDFFVEAGYSEDLQTPHPGSVSALRANNTVSADNIQMEKQSIVWNNWEWENQSNRVARHPVTVGNIVSHMHPPTHSGSMSQNVEHANPKTPCTSSEVLQMQYIRQLQQLNQSTTQGPQLGTSSSEGVRNQFSPQDRHVQMPQQRIGFTKQQLFVLKAQILAYRRVGIIQQNGGGAMPEQLLQAIVPPPLDPQPNQSLATQIDRPNQVLTPQVCSQPHKAFPLPTIVGQGASSGSEEHGKSSETNTNVPQLSPLIKCQSLPKEDPLCKEKAATVRYSPGMASSVMEPVKIGSIEKVEQSTSSELDEENANQMASFKCDSGTDKGSIHPVQSTIIDGRQAKKHLQACSAPTKDVGATRKYHGPIFDFPSLTAKHNSFGSTSVHNANNLNLAYDVRDLLYEEGVEVIIKKKEETLRKIGGLLAVNLERKRIRPDIVLRLQIEERKLRLLDRQAHLRDQVDHQQQQIMAMPDKPYQKFVKQCQRERIELLKQIQLSQKLVRERQLKSIFQWRKKLLETHWAIRDSRTTRNRGIAKYHERMLKEFSKRQDYDRNKRMEALKNNDVDRYREMLLEQQTNISGDASQQYTVLSSFLTQTEEYLHKLGEKITSAKNHHEAEEAANAAAAAARSQGLSEEEVRAAAACAGEEVMIRNRFSEMNAPRDSFSVNKYYNLAHAVNERVVKQPLMLRAGTLRDYQLVGLQWMLSLYNNKLNGILADEMGLGKTVQVMALIAYLMEFKGNYGPHLIIVPNAVLVNWKSELYNWLPSVSCLFYVGAKDERSKLFSQEVCAMKFNVLVTTYEFVMFDRSKLSKIDWKYIIIDEAQRMKNRESVLARDLDRYRCQRRLLLTGTPLQNDLKELWSLLNLLLPEVFDNRKAFHDWFSKPFQKDGQLNNPEEDNWLETEKKVIIIHRLHQILEPFMLRRRVEDVEGSLPRKVSIVLRCRMSAMQGAIYDWIKATGTIRVDPEDELRRVQKNPSYQAKTCKSLNNKCMELRKACNHPLLNYPFFSDYSKGFIVQSCGKLWILDRILIKLHRAGHRVLLFSTMTKLLDILEEYLQWRHLTYRRIDGSTSLEDRESAIVDFNSPKSDCFIFLLSIRAAGRGLNLQTADTVVIYDPDPNPQNEEQAVARAHRIGQRKEVKVIYMESVVDKMPSYHKEDEWRSGGIVDSEDDLAGKDRYIGSIESLIRNNIQQYKIDMADEVINAGRFDQRTTHEERRLTLETLIHDEERYQETVHNVPSLREVNHMIARSEEEINLFDQMDEEFDWTEDLMKYYQVPKWLRAGSGEINTIIAGLSKKPSKNILVSNLNSELGEMASGPSPSKIERVVQPWGPDDKRYSIYREVDEEDGDGSDSSSEGRNSYLLHEGEIGEFEDEGLNIIASLQPINECQSEEGLVANGIGYNFSQALDDNHDPKCDHFSQKGGSAGSSGCPRLPQHATPFNSQKFGSLSALDSKHSAISNTLLKTLEEGEIAMSGDSHIELRQSGSWIRDHDDGKDEQVVQPKLKRKRSIRIRPRCTVERPEDKSSSDTVFPHNGPQLRLQIYSDSGQCPKSSNKSVSERQENSSLSSKQKHNLPSRKVRTSNTPSLHGMKKTIRSNSLSDSEEGEHSGERCTSKAISTSGPAFMGMKMPDIVQKKYKSVISKLLKEVDNDDQEVLPNISGLWKCSSVPASNNLLDPRRINLHVDSFKYNDISDFVADFELMLSNLVQYFGHSKEVVSEEIKLQDIFFNLMKAAFPDRDFLAARHAPNLSGPAGGAPSPSLKKAGASRSKHHKKTNGMEQGQNPTNAMSCSPISAGADMQPEGNLSQFHKGARTRSAGKGLSNRSPFSIHLGDLVIRKGKRKEREKPTVEQRVRLGSHGFASNPSHANPVSRPSLGQACLVSPPNAARVGPASPPNTGRSVRVPSQKDPHQGQQVTHNVGLVQRQSQQVNVLVGVSTCLEELKRARPVKRKRSDIGRRRPGHL